MSKREMILRECQILWQKLYFAEGVDIDKRVIIRRELKEKLKELIENEKIPIPRKIIKEIAGKDWKKLYYLICDRWGGINYFFFERIWESRGGSPIRKILPNSRTHYTFDKFPSVYLSSTGVKPDLAFFPKIENPDSEKVGELTAIILFKGGGRIIKKKETIVNQIWISGNKNLILRARELITKIFKVPKEFVKIYPVGKKRLKLFANSKMIGSYFQNIIGIFELDWDSSVFLTPPQKVPNKNWISFKKGFIKGVIGISAKVGNVIRIKTSWRKRKILERTQEYLHQHQLGRKFSKISPILHSQMKLQYCFQKENIIICRIPSMIPPPPGALIFSENKKEVGEVIEVIKVKKKGKTLLKVKIVEDKDISPESNNLFVERNYSFFIY